MATVTAPRVLQLGPKHNGVLLTPRQFDAADFERGPRYELINGILVVSPYPSRKERDPNDALGHWLRNFQERHPEGSSLDVTLYEETIHAGPNRRRADRAIWAGLGRLPKRNEHPTVAVEFVSAVRHAFERDYLAKRDEYLKFGIKEYWIIDRFARTMTVFMAKKGRGAKRVLREQETYATPLLPGFGLPLARLFTLADQWPDDEDDAE